MSPVPPARIRNLNQQTLNREGDYILYWMIACRRTTWNFSLQRAAEWATELNKPLVILEALRCGYRWASDRFHRFILDGMAENARKLEKHRVLYYPYVEMTHGAGKGLLTALAEKASVVVTDDFPAFFLPRMLRAASQKIAVAMEAVDSNGLLPMRAADRVFPTAYALRRFLQRNLPSHLSERPKAYPLRGFTGKKPDALPKAIRHRWPSAPIQLLEGETGIMAALPIDHAVAITARRGGSLEATRALNDFLEERLSFYPEKRNHPDEEGTSGLSPYLHFGHISVHQVFDRLMEKERWSVDRLSPAGTGSLHGWWGVSEAAEAFLDELITWRELGFNMCYHNKNYDAYETLPSWALKTLSEHEGDQRAYLYSMEDLESAKTHDLLWNAAQVQLRREGRIHNYLRMLWGKKILEWTPTPREALKRMITLNDKYALDGRDPNSYSGIFWVLGRYDRAWGPQRRVFGKVRYMSSENTARKVKVRAYMREYDPHTLRLSSPLPDRKA